MSYDRLISNGLPDLEKNRAYQAKHRALAKRISAGRIQLRIHCNHFIAHEMENAHIELVRCTFLMAHHLEFQSELHVLTDYLEAYDGLWIAAFVASFRPVGAVGLFDLVCDE